MIKLVSYAKHFRELEFLKASGASEVILCHEGLSRLGTLDLPSLQQLAICARDLGLLPVLEWDILMTNDQFAHAVSLLKDIDLGAFSAIRVQDPGALEY